MSSKSLITESERRQHAAELTEWCRLLEQPYSWDLPVLRFHDAGVFDAVRAALVELDRLKAERQEQIRSLPINDWINAQREIGRAIDLLFGRRAKRSFEPPPRPSIDQRASELLAFARSRAARRVASVDDDPDERLLDISLANSLKAIALQGIGSPWFSSCAYALAEYLNGEAAEALISAREDYEAAAQSYFAAEKRLRGVIDSVERLQLPGLHRIAPRWLARSSTAIPFALDSADFPVKRRSEGQDEKLFVFRMYTANRQAVRRPRTEAIHELMHLELFRRQFDRRHLDRLVAEFTAMNADRLARIRAGQEAAKRETEAAKAELLAKLEAR